jgi:hypothetical protein
MAQLSAGPVLRLSREENWSAISGGYSLDWKLVASPLSASGAIVASGIYAA